MEKQSEASTADSCFYLRTHIHNLYSNRWVLKVSVINLYVRLHFLHKALWDFCGGFLCCLICLYFFVHVYFLQPFPSAPTVYELFLKNQEHVRSYQKKVISLPGTQGEKHKREEDDSYYGDRKEEHILLKRVSVCMYNRRVKKKIYV